MGEGEVSAAQGGSPGCLPGVAVGAPEPTEQLKEVHCIVLVSTKLICRTLLDHSPDLGTSSPSVSIHRSGCGFKCTPLLVASPINIQYTASRLFLTHIIMI